LNTSSLRLFENVTLSKVTKSDAKILFFDEMELNFVKTKTI